MRIALAIGLDGMRINDFFEGGSLGRLWNMSEDDDKVDEVSVCRSIMVHTNSSYLVQLGSTQQKRRLTGFQYSLLYLPSANQVDDTGKVSSPLPWPQNTILTPLALQEHLSGVFYPIDHEPTISLVTPRFQTIPGGYILPEPRSNAKGVFAAGDVQHKLKTFTVQLSNICPKYNEGDDLFTSFTAS